MKFRIIATVLNILAVLILAMFVRPAYVVEASEVIQVSTEDELINAIWDEWDAGNEDIIIQLANDIEMEGMGWYDKRVTIDLNGYTFHIFTERQYLAAFWIGGDGELNLVGEGEFNITGVNGHGLCVSGNSNIMVDNITSKNGITAIDNSTVIIRGDVDAFCTIGRVHASYNASVYIAGNVTVGGTGVWVWDYASVIISGNVHGEQRGLTVSDNAVITVYGSVTSERTSVWAAEYTSVVVHGNVYGQLGLSAMDSTKIRVYGDVYGQRDGLTASNSTKITVYGNVSSEHTGVWARGYASVVVHGDVYAERDGLSARENAEITVYGSITGSRTGVSVRGEAIVTVHGHVTGRIFRYDNSVVNIYDNAIITDANNEEHEQPKTQQLTRLTLYIHSYEIINADDKSVVQVMDVHPIIQNSRALVPLYFIANAFDAETNFNRGTQEATLTLGNKSLTITIGQLAPGMDVPAQIINNRIFVPLRFISEFFGAEVEWDRSTQRIDIIWK